MKIKQINSDTLTFLYYNTLNIYRVVRLSRKDWNGITHTLIIYLPATISDYSKYTTLDRILFPVHTLNSITLNKK